MRYHHVSGAKLLCNAGGGGYFKVFLPSWPFYPKYVVWSKVNVLVEEIFSRMIRCQQTHFLSGSFYSPLSNDSLQPFSQCPHFPISPQCEALSVFADIIISQATVTEVFSFMASLVLKSKTAMSQVCSWTILALTCDHIFHSAQYANMSDSHKT